MTLADGFGSFGGPPPGVSAKKNGSGSFSAKGPLGMKVDAGFAVQPGKNGGSVVTERVHASGPIPGMGLWAEVVHGVATNPRDAYERSKRRG